MSPYPTMLRSPQQVQNKNNDITEDQIHVTEMNKTVTVRRSIGEIEARIGTPPLTKPKTSDRLAEAKACLMKAKLQLGNSRNIKNEIRQEVITQIEKLYQIVKDLTVGARTTPHENKKPEQTMKEITPKENTFLEIIKENNKILIENKNKLDRLGSLLESTNTEARKSYVGVASMENSEKTPNVKSALHSVVVNSRNELDTGDQVLETIRETINAKEGWVRVEKVKKAKDRKIIIGCATIEERKKVGEKLKTNEGLKVEEIHNKNPLLVFRDVLRYNEDAEIKKALINQNVHILEGLEEDERISI